MSDFQSQLRELAEAIKSHADKRPATDDAGFPAWKARWDSLCSEYDAEKARVDGIKNRIGRDGVSTINTPPLGSAHYAAGRRSDNPRAYANLFPTVALDSAGFRSPNEYFSIIGRRQYDPRVLALGAGEYSDPLGGFAVPTQYAAEILDTALESEIVRPRARVFPMTSEELRIPRWDGADHSSGALFGGIDAQWTAEGDTPGTTTGKLERLSLQVKRLFVYTKATNQLLDDAPVFRSSLIDAIASTISFQLDQAFLSGTGVGQPLGVLNDPALVTVSKESSQGAGTIVYANLTKMFARMYPAGRSRAIWLANNSCIPQLLSLTVTVGTGGSHVPVMTRGPEGFEVLSRPVIFTEKLPTLGTVGDILFCDFSQYVIGMRSDMRLDASAHVDFASDETAFRAIIRVDGRGAWREPVTPVNGDTLSWCVALESRT